jgi:arsenate reductase-like glutaredoxin family protein
MQTMTVTQAVLTLIQTLPPPERKTIYVWLTEHRAEFEDISNYKKQTFEEEQLEFYKLSSQSLSRAYGDDEPEYSEEDFLEVNPNYNPI